MTQQIINTSAVVNDSTGDSLRIALDAVNNNFSQVWAAGPVDSNVVISNNVISTTPVNTQLILAPAGIGNIQANAHVVPGFSGVYDLGSPERRWDAVHGDYFYGNGFFLTGIQVANVGSLVNGNSNVAINGPGGNITISVNGVPDIVSFNTTSTSFNTNVVVSGNITANYLLGDGSLLTNIVATGGASIDNGNSNVRIGADAANVSVSVSGVGNVAVFTPLGLQVSNSITAGDATISGNITASNFIGNGALLSNITGANVTGNVPKATYAYTAAQAGLAYSANTVTEGPQPAITSVGTLTSLRVTGNINGLANIVSSANVFGNYFIGNGRHLTGVLSSGAKSIANGTSNINIGISDGPITFMVGNIANTAVFTDTSSEFNTDVNVSGNVITGGILTDNYYYANGQPLDMQQPAGSSAEIQFNNNGEFAASANLTFDSEASILSVNGNINTGNINLTGDVSTVGNITASNFIGNVYGNIAGNISVPGSNTEILYNNAGQAAASPAFTFNQNSNTLSVTGNVVATGFTGSGVGLSSTMSDKGGDTNNWNALLEMGTYTVNRVNWGGVTGPPVDSQVYVGLLTVSASNTVPGAEAVQQIFAPGIVDPNNIKVQWVRNYWAGSWTPWVKIVNDVQQIDGGSF